MKYLLVRAWDAFGDWVNVPIYRVGNFETRRVDVILVIVLCLILFLLIACQMPLR